MLHEQDTRHPIFARSQPRRPPSAFPSRPFIPAQRCSCQARGDGAILRRRAGDRPDDHPLPAQASGTIPMDRAIRNTRPLHRNHEAPPGPAGARFVRRSANTGATSAVPTLRRDDDAREVTPEGMGRALMMSPPPDGICVPRWVCNDQQMRVVMSEIITAGLDLAKNMFQVHRADAASRAVLRPKLRRDQVLACFGKLPACVVAMEACGGAHF